MRYIDADALLKAIETTVNNSGCVYHEDEIMDCVKYSPTVSLPSQWISVKNRLPNADKTKNVHEQVTVIVCRNGRVSPMEYERTVVRGKTVYRWRYAWDRLCDDADSITHWMPLPEPPKQEENV